MAKKKNYSQRLDLEVYYENGVYGAWLSDYDGGSGIEVKGDTPESIGEQLAPYIADYLYDPANED